MTGPGHGHGIGDRASERDGWPGGRDGRVGRGGGARERDPRVDGRDGRRESRRWAPPLVLCLLLAVLLFAWACAGDSSAPMSATSSGPAGGSSLSSTTSGTAIGPSSSATAPRKAIRASDGSPNGGDPRFPSAGNGGYDVNDYDISLDIDPSTGHVTGATVIEATATQDLAAFYLDFIGLEVSAVQVDGVDSRYERDGQELKVTCPQAVAAGDGFSARVMYSGVPKSLREHGWQRVDDTIFTFDEPQGAATWYPVNDIPSDKATYSFHLSVPQPYTATANGVLTRVDTEGSKRTFNWRMDDPQASYLASVVVGKLVSETSTSAGGVTIRNYFAAGLAAEAQETFSRTAEVMDFYVGLLGPYPFDEYGVVVPDADAVAMENQSLSTFGRDRVDADLIIVAHELAHQWVGDSVTIKRWDDIWLNEGFATYISWLWKEHDQGEAAFAAKVQENQRKSLDARDGPVVSPESLFDNTVYRRGALTLHAIRLIVGDDSFFRILREWTQRYKYQNAETADFIALVKEEAPQVPPTEIDALFDTWLYQRETPVLPH